MTKLPAAFTDSAVAHLDSLWVRAGALTTTEGARAAMQADLSRKRAERRLGEVMEERRATDKLAKGAREHGTRRGTTRVANGPASLAKQGIDKHLADRARKAAVLTDRQFEADVAKAARRARAAVEGNKAIIREARAEQQREKRDKRQQRQRELAGKIKALPVKRYGVIVADPEWRFEPWSRETGMDRAAANHYPTSALPIIKSRNVESISAKDCVLFLWATAPMNPHALVVMDAWGFDYKTQMIWGKDKIGTGYWFREKHELLLVGTKGKPICPAQGDQWDSLQLAPRRGHSAKPEIFLEMIEQYFPNVPKIELNRRGPPWLS
jgi:N6-adenosine-specific RNA methylase IME4